MTRTQLLEKLEKLSNEKLELIRQRNSKYATEENGWGNLGLIEHTSGQRLTAEQGIFVRASDKLARLGNMLFDAPDDDPAESLEDTLLDLSNYADLMLIKLRERRAYERGVEQEKTAEIPSQMQKFLDLLRTRYAAGNQ